MLVVRLGAVTDLCRSSGLLLYAALVDLLAEDFLSEEANRLMTKKDKTVAFCFVLAGAAGMSFVGAFA